MSPPSGIPAMGDRTRNEAIAIVATLACGGSVPVDEDRQVYVGAGWWVLQATLVRAFARWYNGLGPDETDPDPLGARVAFDFVKDPGP